MSVRFGVVVFPGSNCDHDCYYALKHAMGQDVRFVWHKESRLENIDVVVLPGGFSYGDHLRTGAIARFSPVMEAVVDFAQNQGLVIGICNGFQILCEAGLLPGVLMRNASLRFVCEFANIRVENNRTTFSNRCRPGQVLRIPVAHAEGLYFADDATLERLNEKQQVLFRYCDPKGDTSLEANPNGSLQNIAGIMNEQGNVLGMMPHPDRCFEDVLTSRDGVAIFESIIQGVEHGTAALARGTICAEDVY